MVLQRFITEIRYIPDPEFLDKRGKIVKKVVSENFDGWRISKDRVELQNEDGLIFASFRNLGFTTRNKDKLEFFIQTFEQVLKEMNDLPPVRWGVRIISLTSSRKTFNSLLNSYKEQLIKYDRSRFTSIGGRLTDIGVSYEFKKDHNTYHLTSGPMRKEQARGLFGGDLPENGIFVDLDISREGEQFYGADFRESRIMDFIKEAFEKGNDITDKFIRGLNGR